MLTPIFEEYARKHTDHVCAEMDYDSNKELVKKLTVRVIPTIIVFHENKVIGSFEGFCNADKLEKEISELLKKAITALP